MSAPVSPAWDEFWRAARQAPILAVAEKLQIRLKKAGADLTAACPRGCASADGFVITPRNGTFICRPSGEGGGGVELVAHAHGCSNVEAAEFILDRDRPDRTREETAEARAEREARSAEWKRAAEVRRAEDERAEADKARRDDEAIAAILARAVPIAGTHAEACLRARGLTPPRRLLGDMRFVSEIAYWGYASAQAEDVTHLATLPALVAAIRNIDGEVVGIQARYLDPKLPAPWVAPHERHLPKKDRRNKDKKIRGFMRGCMVRLGLLSESLALAEGTITALGWYSLGLGPEDVSLACGLSLGNLAAVELPDFVRNVYLIGDGDSEPRATHLALAKAGDRFAAQGRRVFIQVAPAGRDFGDVAERARIAA